MRNPWNVLAGGTPGHRFSSVYEERHRRRSGSAARPAAIAAGVALALLGTLMIVTPGPGFAVFLVGAALLASESKAVARSLDWCELKARAIFRKL